MPASRPSRLRLLLAACAVGVALVGDGSAQADPSCTAWAGEFDPLPTVSDPDPLRARWARLRVEQLGQLASRAEPRDREEANRLWQRVRCLEPDSATALAGIERTRADVSRAPEPPARERSASGGTERGDAKQPVPSKRTAPVARARAQPAAQAPAKPTQSVVGPLERTEALIRAARFEDALGEIERLRPEAVRPAERARLEVLAATAQVAFGREQAARASIERALSADPGLALDERSTSPKLLRLLQAAREPGADPIYEPAAADVEPLVEPGTTP